MGVNATASINPLSGPTVRRLGPLPPSIAATEPAPGTRDDDAAPDCDRVALWGVGLPLFAEVFVQKLAIPLGSTAQISATLLLGFVGLGLLIVTGRVVIDGPRFILYATMITALVVSQLLGD